MACDLVQEERSLLRGESLASIHANFPSAPATAGLARALVKSVIDSIPDVDDDVAWTARLLTSELVTNAVIHARTHIHVGVIHDGDRLLIAVTDEGKAPTLRPVENDPTDDESGRGMLLVAALADDFGWSLASDHGSKTIWVLLTLERVK